MATRHIFRGIAEVRASVSSRSSIARTSRDVIASGSRIPCSEDTKNTLNSRSPRRSQRTDRIGESEEGLFPPMALYAVLAVSDDMTSLGRHGGGFAIGPCRTRISGCAGSWAERGRRLATRLMIWALDSGRGRVRPTGWVTPEYPPRRHSLCAATRPRPRHSGDRSAKTAAPPAGESGIHRYSA